MTSSF